MSKNSASKKSASKEFVDGSGSEPQPKTKRVRLTRSEEADLRRRRGLAQNLLKLAHPGLSFTFSGKSCAVADEAGNRVSTLPDYMDSIMTLVPAKAWLLLKKEDRYLTLNALIPGQFRTPVVGGVVYQIRQADVDGRKDHFVFLTIGHELRPCELVPSDLMHVRVL